MPTLVEELVHYLDNVRFPRVEVPEARDRLQSELKKESGSRILNKLNSKEHHSDLHALNKNKYKELMALFDQASQIAIKKGKFQEGMFILDPVSESTLRSWIDALVLEGCEMLLDDKGQIRQDVLSFLGLKSQEKQLNETNNLLQSFVQHMTEELSLEWHKNNVGKVESGKDAVSKMTKEEKEKNEEASYKASVFASMQYFFNTYFKNEKYIRDKVDEYLFCLASNIPAKCASELKEMSQKFAPSDYQQALKNYILADLQKTTLLTKKEKVEFWLDVVSFSAGNGDYKSLGVFLELCEKEPKWIAKLSETSLSQHISCQSLFTYYKKGWIGLDVKGIAEQPHKPVEIGAALVVLDDWIYARNNNVLIEVIFQKYHRQANLPKSGSDIQEKEKNILLQLEKIKFEDALLTPTAKFLKVLAERTGKEGRLAAIIANLVTLEKYEHTELERGSTFISNSNLISQAETSKVSDVKAKKER